MAHSKEHQRATYPLAAYNFRVIINGVTMSFAEVSGLHIENQVVTYRHGLSFKMGEEIVIYRIDKYVSVTLKRGTVPGKSFLYEWLEKKETCSMDVQLCDEGGIPVIGWSIAKALPVKLDAPTFDARTNDVSVETLEIKAAGISVKELS